MFFRQKYCSSELDRRNIINREVEIALINKHLFARKTALQNETS